jgi:hypothetical protein
MADRRPGSGRMRQSRRRAEGARAAPEGADVLGRVSDALSLLNVAQNSLPAKEISGTSDEVVALRYASDALRRIYSEIDRRPKSPGTE